MFKVNSGEIFKLYNKVYKSKKKKMYVWVNIDSYYKCWKIKIGLGCIGCLV